MNTTKLHLIAKDLLSELARVETVSLIQQVIQSLQQSISQPQQPAYQQQLTTHLNNLYEKLENSPIDNYSPAWRDAMEELRLSDEFGSKLEKRIKDIFERNQITPQSALIELQKIEQEITGTENNLTGLVTGLEYFGVGEDKLSINECEIGIIVPRAYVKDNLKNFGAELIELEKTLIVFSELVTGQREPLKIRQISSSELSVFLEYTPEIGACVAVAVERIVALYKKLLEIKKLKKDLIKQEVPEEALVGIDSYAKSKVSPELEELASELLGKYGNHINETRANEVLMEIRHSLNKLANRIDRGFNIEIRVAPLEEETGDEQTDSPNKAAIQQIIESASKISHLEQSGDPVLFLPENDDEKKI